MLLAYACVFDITSLVGTRSPHKDSKTRNIHTSGDISSVPTRKRAILGLEYNNRIKRHRDSHEQVISKPSLDPGIVH
jgi:hypothetical protein